jgi:hypothetical protein
MFADVDFVGKPITKDYAATRARWEPIVEVTQQKGDGETHPYLSPDDEFADFGRWDKLNLNGALAHENAMFQFEYARRALERGLQFEEKLGVNPFKFGMIGSTDSHVGIPAVEEDNYFGKVSLYEPNPHRWDHVVTEYPKDPNVKVVGWEMLSSGYAGVWARENTREAIFDAMKRKEVYATTGARITVRFFGGWGFQPQDANTRMPAAAESRAGKSRHMAREPRPSWRNTIVPAPSPIHSYSMRTGRLPHETTANCGPAAAWVMRAPRRWPLRARAA